MRNPKKMSCSEAGKLGAIASKITAEKQTKERREKYYLNPLLCLECSAVIPYEKRHGAKFCGSSCGAIHSNRKRAKKYEGRFCAYCSKHIEPTYKKRGNTKYCSSQCSGLHRSQQCQQELIELGYDPSKNCKQAKRYIIETKGHACEICHLTTWLDQPIPLTLDHINGNPEDNSLTNLRVICPNCDRLTPTFGAKNRGNGRHYRRQRYKEGKSY